MSVNAEDLFVLIFMWVCFLLGFRLRTSRLPSRSRGTPAGQGLRQTSVLRVSQRVLFWGCWVFGFCSPRFPGVASSNTPWLGPGPLRMGALIAVFADKVNIYFLLFLGRADLTTNRHYYSGGRTTTDYTDR